MRERPVEVFLSVEPIDPGEKRIAGLTQIVGENPMRLAPGEHRPIRVIVQAEPDASHISGVRENVPVRFVLQEQAASVESGAAGRVGKNSIFTVPE